MNFRRLVLAPVVAATALVASSCSVYDAPLPGGADPGKDPMKVTILFRDVLDLVPQSNVKLDDVTIGKVSKIELDDYVAKVTVEIPNDIDLPENVRVDIRQTSLLGEKFVSFSQPEAPRGALDGKDTIGLAQTGRNPEVEEVLSALSALLNGGGVAQLKTIAHELNIAFGGREDQVKDVIKQVGDFMGQLDANKGAIVTALQNLNRLALELRRQDPTIKSALDEIPAALASLDRQRSDLVKMLGALERLSGVGVEVIRASKAGAIDSLRALAPVLHEFAKAGQDLPNSLEALLTYPFIDAAVGRDPQFAENLHMGDYVNLSVRLDLDLGHLPGLPGLPGGAPDLNTLIEQCATTPLAPLCTQINAILGGGGGLSLPSGRNGETADGTGAPAPGQLPALPDLDVPLDSGASGDGLSAILSGFGLARPATGFDVGSDPFRLGVRGVDSDLGTLLLQGVAIK